MISNIIPFSIGEWRTESIISFTRANFFNEPVTLFEQL